MSVYSYTTDSIEIFEDSIIYGSLADTPTEIVDGGNILVSANIVENNGYIVNTQTIYPFGSAKVFGNSESSFSRSSTTKVESLKLTSKITEGIRFTWIGSGTLFEIGGGQERIIAPWVGSSGPLRIFGSAATSAVYQYDQSSISLYSIIDFGGVLSTPNTSINYGVLFPPVLSEEDYGSIVIASITYPHGLFKISGAFSDLTRTFGHQSQGTISLNGSAQTDLEEPSTQIYKIESTDLFKVSGLSNNNFTRSTYISSGRITLFNSVKESSTTEYNQSSISLYSLVDFGNVNSQPSSSVDQGIISLPALSEENYGSILITNTTYPYGLLNLSGSVLSSTRTFGYQSQGIISLNGSAQTSLVEPSTQTFRIRTTDLFKVSGYSSIKFTKALYIGSGSLSFNQTRKESATYDYNLYSEVEYNVENYGLILDIGTSVDSGFINVPVTTGEESYGYISSLYTETPFGSLTLLGSSATTLKPSFAYVGEGSLFAAGGEGIITSFGPDGFALFDIFGYANTSIIRNYNSTGSVFAFANTEESVTFDYNDQSTELFSKEDYEFITSSGSSEDYGFITLTFDAGEDSYGYIGNLTTTYPFGSIGTLYGSVEAIYKPTFSQVGKAHISVVGNTSTQFIPSYDSFGLFNVTGGETYSKTTRIVSKNSILSFGSKQESATFDYNDNSIVFFSKEDYEFITAVGSTEDYGLINSELDAGEDSYGYIANIFTQYPFGSVGQLHGIVEITYKPTFSQVGKAYVSIIGNTTTQFIPSYDSFGLFNVTGGERYSRTIINVSTAPLFAIGSDEGSVTFDYNESSIVFFTEEDYQFITSSGSAEDYGLITSELDAGEDSYGYIGNVTTVYPFGSIGTFNGSVESLYKPSFSQVGKSHISVVGNTTTQFIPSYDSFGLFNITGGDRYSRTIINVSTASLLTIGSDEGSVTFDYNTNSVVFYTTEDHEFITSSGSTEDYGFIISQLDAGEDSYGYIGNVTTVYPFGSIGQLHGLVEVDYKPTFSQVGKAHISIIGNTTTQFIPSYDSFGLFNVTGGDRYSRTIINASSASLFTIGSDEGSVTFDYNTSSVVFFSKEDYQFITTSGSSEDYGFISYQLDAGEDSYGYIGNLTTVYPFGSVGTLSSTTNEAFTPSPHIVTGSLFGLNGTAESTSINPLESTALFKFSGTLVERNTESYFGSGSLFTIGSDEGSVTFDYNTSSVIFYEEEDYQFITTSGSVEDYGLINSEIDAGEDSYGYIFNKFTQYPFGSIGPLHGIVEITYKPTFGQIGKAHISIIGDTTTQFIPSYDSFGLFNVTGGERYSRTIINVSTASILSFGNTEDSATFDYNDNSIVFFTEEDYQFITSSGSAEDCGLINSKLDAGEESYGYIGNLTTVYPFGSIGTLGGSVTVDYKPSFSQVGKAHISVIGNTSTEFVPSYDSFGLFNITGGDRYSRTIINVSTASLFTIGSDEGSVTFDYNTSSVVFFSEEDYEFITSTGSTEDYGFIYSQLNAGEDSYGYIGNLTTVYPFGSIGTLSSTTNEAFTPSPYNASGTLFGLSGVAESVGINPQESTALFKFSGTLVERNTESYAGSGSLFALDGLVESAAFNYNTSSVVLYTEEDYEFITSSGSTEDYGHINSEIDAGEESYGHIGNLTTVYPFGSIGNLGGFAITDFELIYGQITTGSFKLSGESLHEFVPSYDSFGLFNITGGERYSRTIINVSSASLLSFGNTEDSATFDYNTSSVVFFSEEDYEFITASGSTEDYGFVGLPLNSGEDSYGYIGNVTTVYPFGSIGTLSSTTNEAFTPSPYNASGTLFGLSGVAESVGINPQESTALFKFSGTLVERNTESYAGSGSLFALDGLVESAAFNYNTSSVVLYTEEDYEFITSTGSTEDYGFIYSQLNAGEDSYGYIGNLTTVYPFGSIGTFSSTTKQAFAPSSYNASGSIFGLNGSAESTSVNSQESTALFKFSGTLVERNTESYFGSGSLFTLSGLVESATFDYNTSSVVLFSEEDYQFITSSGSTEDYGIINAQVDAGEDSYGYIGNLTTVYPFGSIGTLSSTTNEAFTPSPYNASGTLFGLSGVAESITVDLPEFTGLFKFSGTSVERNTESYVGVGNTSISGHLVERNTESYVGSGSVSISVSSEEAFTEGVYTASGTLFGLSGVAESITVDLPEFTGLFKFSGTSVERNTESYAGSGSLFAIGGLVELATFHYNTSSVVFYTEEDYEFITASGSTENYGFINSELDAGEESYGHIGNLTTVYPFGSIGTLSGHSVEVLVPAFAQSGKAYIRLSGESLHKFVPSYDSFGLFNITGGERYSRAIANVSTASLFSFGNTEESATFDYNTSSVVFFSEEDYQFITLSAEVTENYGSVGLPLDSGIDSYGYIGNLTTVYPFGSIGLFSGFAKQSFTEGVYTASGTLFGLNGVAESITVDLPEFTGLFKFFGSSAESNTESYVGFGSLFAIDGLVETVTTSENITTLFNLYGSAEESFTEGVYTGSGSLFAFVGAAESITVDLPEFTGLFKFSGSSTESNTESYVGVGNTSISGHLVERNTESYVGSGSVSISVSSEEAFAEGVYTGSGSLFAFIGASESVGVDLPEFTTLFKLSGRSAESFSEGNYNGSGTLTCSGFVSDIKVVVAHEAARFNNIFISGSAVDLQRNSYFGSGSLFGYVGAAESKTVDLPEFFGLFSIKGSAKESFTESNYDGSGSTQITGFVSDIKLSYGNIVSGRIQLSGISDTRFVPNWNAFGSLFGYSGAAESRTIDLPEFFGLFNINGTKFESYSKAPYVGSGFTTFSGHLVERNTESYVGSGSINLSGKVSDIKLSYGNFGSGSLFGYSGAAESKTVDLPEFFGLFNINGTKFESYSKAPYVGSGSVDLTGVTVERNTESYVGFGNTSITGIAKELFVSNNIGFGSVYVYGNLVEKQTDSYRGSGSLFGILGLSESFSANLQVTTLFTLSGTSKESHTENYVGVGSVSFGASAKDLFTPNNIGSGSLFALSGSSESYTIAERSFGLFTISGSKVERTTSDITVIDRFATIYGNSLESHTEVYIGSGSTFINGSSTNNFTSAEIGSGSVYLDGLVVERQTDDYVGSGSLFTFIGSEESVVVSPDVTFGLFTIFGSVIEKNTESYVGSGNTSVFGVANTWFIANNIGSGSVFTYGNAVEKQTDDYVGFGSLFGFRGAQESATVNPTENTVLFRFYGTSTERNTESYVGFGSELLSGTARTKFVPNWNGSGSVNINGAGKESHTEIYIGYITQEISGFATEIIKISSYQGYAEINISGYIIETQSDSYNGSGTLFGISGSEDSASYNPQESTALFGFSGSSTSSSRKHFTGSGSIFEFNGSSESSSKAEESIGLFKFDGSATIVSPRKYNGSGTLSTISGSSESILYNLPEFNGLYSITGYALSNVTSNPPENTAQYIVSGNVSNIKLSHSNKGFGSLFGINGASVVATPSYITEKIEGIRILGSADESYARSSYNASGVQIITGFAESEYRFYEPSFTYVIII